MNFKQISKLAIAAALASAGLSAQAYDSWSYTGNGAVDTVAKCTGTNTTTCTTAGATTNALTTSGVYATNLATSCASGQYLVSSACYTTRSTTKPSGTYVKSGSYYYSGSGTVASSNGITGNWAAGTLTSYPGLGMTTNEPNGGTAPNHALDNAGTYTEGVLLSFATATVLTGIDLSYVNNDADISVFRYTGTTMPVMGSTCATMTTSTTSSASGCAAGWELVGNYANLSQDPDSTAPLKYNLINGATDTKETPTDVASTVNPTVSSTSEASSWWLVVAYNTAYGSGTNLNQGDDYFKLLSVAGTTCTTTMTNNGCGNTTNNGGGKVPEPGSLALASLALCGLFYSRRRFGAR